MTVTFFHFLDTSAVMKTTGVCPKCKSEDIKINTLGSWGNMTAGNFYRCKACGFTEIWSDKAHQRDLGILVGVSIGGSIIALAILAYFLLTG
ncbi:MAG TPA: hypothetical protein D7I05_07830 [Candidatus Poseidoniales archaeon]|nr:MAG TPA: hypothetical protein D7I05_07830 [Candidatus Poseidoniales archaeon]